MADVFFMLHNEEFLSTEPLTRGRYSEDGSYTTEVVVDYEYRSCTFISSTVKLGPTGLPYAPIGNVSEVGAFGCVLQGQLAEGGAWRDIYEWNQHDPNQIFSFHVQVELYHALRVICTPVDWSIEIHGRTPFLICVLDYRGSQAPGSRTAGLAIAPTARLLDGPDENEDGIPDYYIPDMTEVVVETMGYDPPNNVVMRIECINPPDMTNPDNHIPALYLTYNSVVIAEFGNSSYYDTYKPTLFVLTMPWLEGMVMVPFPTGDATLGEPSHYTTLWHVEYSFIYGIERFSLSHVSGAPVVNAYEYHFLTGGDTDVRKRDIGPQMHFRP